MKRKRYTIKAHYYGRRKFKNELNKQKMVFKIVNSIQSDYKIQKRHCKIVKCVVY